jgi:uncharacterized LabA/DUF88 family protein
MLVKTGFDIKSKTMIFKEKGGKLTNSSWDVGITIDMIKWKDKLDTIILVSGNGIFFDCFEYLKNFCRIEVAGFPEHSSSSFRKNINQFIELKDSGMNILIDGNFKDKDDNSEDNVGNEED